MKKEPTRLADRYQDTRDQAERLVILRQMRESKEVIPLEMAEDLLSLPLDNSEKCALIEVISCSPSLDAEDFLTAQIPFWPQDLASSAIIRWAQQTPRDLWFRLIPLIRIPTLPQRVRYTLLNHCWTGDARQIICALLESTGWQDLSITFQNLVLEKCLQFGVDHPAARQLARDLLHNPNSADPARDKAQPWAMLYVATFDRQSIPNLNQSLRTNLANSAILSSLNHTAEDSKKLVAKLSKAVTTNTKKGFLEKIWENWPTLLARGTVEADLLSEVLAATLKGITAESDENSRGAFQESMGQMLWGFRPEVIEESVFRLAQQVPIPFPYLEQFICFLPRPIPSRVVDSLAESLRQLSGDEKQRLPVALRQNRSEMTPASLQIAETLEGAEAKAVSKADISSFNISFAQVRQQLEPTSSTNATPLDVGRHRFVEIAYRHRSLDIAPCGNAFWDAIIDSWLHPHERQLHDLALASRAAPKIYQYCYIQTLGRFVGMDEAALKLLDYVRTEDEAVLRLVIQALSGINTPRSLQELVNSITRPNASLSIQLEICSILHEKDLRMLQPELRSTYDDLAAKYHANDDRFIALRDALSHLILPQAVTPDSETTATNPAQAIDDSVGRDLDKVLVGKIPFYRELSAEVRRSLRTAQFFHDIVPKNANVDAIDLSPVIDMQYKSLELLFRESFEEIASHSIEKGVLQHKLDVIGYARPIPAAMDEFENYIGSLPIVKNIPFFSKFKLRKMLRAICQFRPGRRFTLDGLKAFALFFLCFSRQECRYGLANLFPAGFASDQKLFEFCQLLHVFQDSRNRAAHEGFQPEARGDIQGIWRSTAEIIQYAHEIKAKLSPKPNAEATAERAAAAAAAARKVIVTKKVS